MQNGIYNYRKTRRDRPELKKSYPIIQIGALLNTQTQFSVKKELVPIISQKINAKVHMYINIIPCSEQSQ